jgi:hypothetical protein
MTAFLWIGEKHVLLLFLELVSLFPMYSFILLPLDITTLHEIPFPLYKQRVDPAFESTLKPSIPSDKPPLHHFTSSFLERTREVMCEFGKDAMELHDPVAVWFAIANPPSSKEKPIFAEGWNGVRRRFDVERSVSVIRFDEFHS